MKQLVRGLLKASHFGPTVLVVTTTLALALSQFSFLSAVRVAIAIFVGQLVVGWSNDLIDYPRDFAAHRIGKPLVAGDLSTEALKTSIKVAMPAVVLLSYLSPLGFLGTVIHLGGILSAITYNLWLKSTVLSPLPYAFSFGALPWAIYLSAKHTPPIWLYLGFILFALAFHFLNVLKDLDADIKQGVLGLPQRLGRSSSIKIASLLIVAGILDVALLLRL